MKIRGRRERADYSILLNRQPRLCWERDSPSDELLWTLERDTTAQF